MTTSTFQDFGLTGQDLSEMEAFSAMRHAQKVEEAVNYFTSQSTEFHESPDLIGEVYSDYEETMHEFFEMCV